MLAAERKSQYEELKSGHSESRTPIKPPQAAMAEEETVGVPTLNYRNVSLADADERLVWGNVTVAHSATPAAIHE